MGLSSQRRKQVKLKGDNQSWMQRSFALRLVTRPKAITPKAKNSRLYTTTSLLMDDEIEVVRRWISSITNLGSDNKMEVFEVPRLRP